MLSLHGSQFKTAALIVASPPCQAYSWMAMPWSLAKAKAAAIRADTTGVELEKLNRLFNACFRIQREASEAAGHHIPMVVENVRGAQPWVGRARWNFGSFYLFGDVPALMPMTAKAIKVPTMGAGWYPPDHPKHVPGLGFNTHAARNLSDGMKVPGFRFDGSGKSFQSASVEHTGTKVPSELGRRTDPGKGSRFTSRDCGSEKAENVVVAALEKAGEGRKGYAAVLGQSEISRAYGSKSPQRKMASAMIAKIPLPLSRWVAATYFPKVQK